MNPKKRILEFFNHSTCDHPNQDKCEHCDTVKRIMDGMSMGTASLVIESAVSEKYVDSYKIKGLKNRGRYYIASVVGQDGKVIQQLMVDKQSGGVQFV